MSAFIYSAIINLSPFAHFHFDLQTHRFTLVNPAFTALFGFTAEEAFSSHNFLSIINPDDREYLEKCFNRLLQGSVQTNIEFRVNVNNAEKWIRLTAVLSNGDSDNAVIGYALDFTAETNNLNTLKKYTNKKNSALNILAHDLRGPLGIANTLTQVLTKKVDDPHLAGLVQNISKILKQSINMITDLTGREFLETTDVELVKQRINITLKAKEYIEEYQNAEEMSKRTFLFSASDDSIFVNIDESKFMQVLNNLMTNALKFTSDDGIITLHIQEHPDSVIFSLSDNGIGIPLQFHSTLFQKFTDARRKGLHGEPTVGLGLSIIKTIIEWHNGKIWFDSKEGIGSTFYVEIPKI